MATGSLKKLLFAVLASICLLSSIWYILFYHSSPWYGIYAGFDDESGLATLIRVPADSAAERAGLHRGDAILGYNGNPVRTEEDTAALIREMQYSDSVRLEVRRGDEVSDIVLHSGLRPFRLTHLAYAVVGLLYISMGSWVFFARPQYQAANAWGIFSLLMGSIIIERNRLLDFFDPGVVIIVFFGILQFVILFAVALHFALLFPRPRRMAKKRWLVATLYTIPILLFLTIIGSYFLQQGYYSFTGLFAFVDSLQLILLTYLIFYFGLTLTVLLTTYLRTVERTEKRRIRWIVFGTAVPLGFFLATGFIVLVLNLQIPYLTWLLIVSFSITPIAYFYAIVRHRAMQMELIFRRGLIYALVTGAVLLATGLAFALVFGLPLLLQNLVPELSVREGILSLYYRNPAVQMVSIAIWAMVVGATVGRLKRRVQEFVDRRFYREKYNYRQALRQLTSVLDQAGDRERMLGIVSENIEQLFHPRSIAIALIREDGTAEVAHAVPKTPAPTELDAEATAILRGHFDRGTLFLGRREMEENNYSAAQADKGVLDLLGADLCLPMKAEGEVLGLLFLGGKRSELSYSMEDLELLGLLADQAAHGIEHMRLAEAAGEKERIQRELQIGRDIQRSMLPPSPPRLEGVSIAALNIPAMEVGGDFYTFTEYGPRKVGIIVGDIVGKGVAGAINMAATISSLRLIAEESESVPEAMEWLNRYLVRSPATRSFAAVTFAVLDLDSKTVHWSNAGLPEPVIVPARGPVRFLEMEGYPLPPGASERSDYGEASCRLRAGDSVVFVTDGVVEARPAGDSGDEFGFDRLLRVLDDHRLEDPDTLLFSLAEELNTYCGGAEYEDDITAVAVRIEANAAAG